MKTPQTNSSPVTIQAKVNARLLTKADRLFTGTLQGRVIEILQNARRAHATRVEITNEDGRVTIRDNGNGITDFGKLLDMGGSGWDEGIEEGEDPAGVGLFCLAPREVHIRSNGKMVNIGGAGWTGAPVAVQNDPNPVEGTILRFWDEEWTSEVVDSIAVFSGMDVIVDGTVCPKLPFVSKNASHHEDLGCRIEVVNLAGLSGWHRDARRGLFSHFNVLINFHGQVLGLTHHPIGQQDLAYLIDLTGEPTGIRLMLPARTQLVENQASSALMKAMEVEGYRDLQCQGQHTLPYKDFLRARELGIQLPEATAKFEVGLITTSESPEPVEVNKPEKFPLSKCYRMAAELRNCENFVETNTHLLAALGTFEKPFIPVSINGCYDGYSWANLPTIENVDVKASKELHADYLWSGRLVCVDEIVITVSTSDGKTHSSRVCMAIRVDPPADAATWCTEDVLVTPEARERLFASQLWHHLGGWSEDGDTYDTQEHSFGQELDRFWADLVGPDEHLRRLLMEQLLSVKGEWRRIMIDHTGAVVIQFADSTVKTISPSALPK